MLLEAATINHVILHFQSLFSENSQFELRAVNVNHMKNVCQSALSTDIETNPGPVFYVDPNKTISAPYSQGNQIIFGETVLLIYESLMAYQLTPMIQ